MPGTEKALRQKRWGDVFISGVAAEWVTKFVLHPFDTLKASCSLF